MPSEKVLHEIYRIVQVFDFSGLFRTFYNQPSYNFILCRCRYRTFVRTIDRTDTGGSLFRLRPQKIHQVLKICGNRRNEKSAEFIKCLPELRRLLATDVIAAYNGDRQRRVTEKSYFVTLQYGLSAITALLTVLFNWEYRLFLE